jgi:hypothetical protein
MRAQDAQPGQEVVADGQAVGEVVGMLEHNGADYLHIRRYGYGLDDLYIPTLAVDHRDGRRLYLRIGFDALAAQGWHELPSAQTGVIHS